MDEIRILHLEDDPLDSELILQRLRGDGLRLKYRWVTDGASFRKALGEGDHDLVLSDFGLQGFTGLQALQELRAAGHPTPFILLTGTIDEQAAVEILRHGATDYILKNRLERLTPAIHRALKEAEERLAAQSALERLKKNEQLLTQVAAGFNAVIWMADVDFSHIFYVSPWFARIWQRDADELIQSPDIWRDSLHPEDRDEVLRESSTWYGSGSFEMEYRIRLPDGAVRWIHDRRYPVPPSPGTSPRFTGFMEDVTGRKLTMRLRMARQMIGRALDHTADPLGAMAGLLPELLAIFEWDLARVWLWDEVEGRLVPHTESRPPGVADPGPVPDGESLVAAVWADPKAISRHEGTVGTAGALGLAVPLVGPSAPLGVLELRGDGGYGLDPELVELMVSLGSQLGRATEHALTTSAMRESQNQMRAVIDAVPSVILVKDLAGRLLYMNRTGLELLGLPDPKVLGRTERELLPADAAGEIEQEEALSLASGRPRTHEITMEMRGEKRTYVLGIFPLRDTKGRVKAMGAIRTDITEQRRLEAQIHQTQKMEAVGRLAGGIAHDFNNLLTIILGYAEALIDELEGTDERRDSALEIHKAGTRAATLTKQLLQFSRQEPLELRVTQLNSVISELEKMLRRLIGEDIELVTDFATNLSLVDVDRGRMEQVILNLVINARDAMPRGGKLTIATRLVDRESAPAPCREVIGSARMVMLEVKDTGAGMDHATRQRIFEPFFTTKPRGQGTGLGLATVFGIVEQSHGWIGVESEPGRGTAFRIHLPPSRQGSLEIDGEADGVTGARVAARILIVEDEAGVNTLARRILENAGYTVTDVSDPGAALERVCVDEQVFDLVLTDVIMPQMSGPQMVKQMRATVPALRVVYMSGYTDEKLAGQGPEVDAATLLSKPFSRADLLRVVARALEGE